MPYYKDQNDGVHFLDDSRFENALPAGCVQISDEEATRLQQPTPLNANELILSQIAGLEASVTDRRIREAVLGIDHGWLKGINDQISALRAQLTK